MSTRTQREVRQREILPPQRLAACHATVVGVGAIGRQVALQLAAIGLSRMQLVDPQEVEEVNLACQGYLDEDLGQSKVRATAQLCRQIQPGMAIDAQVGRFRRSLEVGNVLFCCVDSIETRQRVWEAVRERVSFYADGRMSAEVLRICTVAEEAGRQHYPGTLFGEAEAYQDACTARSTIFTANIAAGLMLEQFARWLRGLRVDADLQLNLLASELSVA